MADEHVWLWFQGYEDLSRYFPGTSVYTGHTLVPVSLRFNKKLECGFSGSPDRNQLTIILVSM